MHSPPKEIVFINGFFLPADEAIALIKNRIICFSRAIHKTLKVVNGVVECFEPHLRLFYEQCSSASLYPPLITKKWIQKLISYNGAKRGHWKLNLIVTKDSPLEEKGPPKLFSHFAITIKPLKTAS